MSDNDSKRIVTAKQVQFLQALRPAFHVDHVSSLNDNLTEFRGRLDDWTLGRDCYIWMTNDGKMLANAAKEFDTHGRDPEHKTIVVSHKITTWHRDSPGVHLSHDVDEERWTSFFMVAKTMGPVPELRRWCLAQVEEHLA